MVALVTSEDRVLMDSVRGINASAAEAVLHRGGDGITWKGVTVRLVGTWVSADCLEINGHRPNLKGGGEVPVPNGEHAGTYTFQVMQGDRPHSAKVRITRSIS